MIHFVDGTFLSDPYKRTMMLGACTLGADNLPFQFHLAYVIVPNENNDKWLCFLLMVVRCMVQMIMSNSNSVIISRVVQLFRMDYRRLGQGT